jgi:hypothetical protein
MHRLSFPIEEKMRREDDAMSDAFLQRAVAQGKISSGFFWFIPLSKENHLPEA